MRRNTKGNGFTGAVIVTVLTVVLMLLLTWAMLSEYFGGFADLFVTGIVLFSALLFIAIAVGAVKALYQRWREIEKGELDEARKY